MPKADQVNIKSYHKRLERMAKQSNVSWRQRTNLGRDQVRITTLDDPRMIKAFYCSMINSTSKMRVALGGIGPCPRGPYLESALVNFGMVQ